MSRTVSILAAGLAAALSGCGRTAPAEGAASGVLLVAIDGLRADHVGFHGHDRPTTPTLDALASEGVAFLQAFATAPLLVPSHVSLFTGCDPLVARRFVTVDLDSAEDQRWRLPGGLPHLAVELLASGYRTAAFVDDPLLDPDLGFGPGFQEYALVESDGPAREGRTPELARRFLQWLRSVDRDGPWFAYLHLADLERSWSFPDREWSAYFEARPELDEVPPVANTDALFFAIPFSRWRGGSRSIGHYEAAYDGHLRRLDEELGELFASLRRLGRYEDTTIAVVGTHGIQLGEAGLYLRGGLYSTGDLHVPWILRPRSGAEVERGRRVEGLASLMDVPPTLLALEGLSRPPGMHGVSQTAWIAGEAPAVPPRRFAFASCGLLEGGAVIGERFCLESLAPGLLEDDALRQSWYGERSGDDADERSVRFYDRRATPFPALGAGDVDPRDERYRELRRVRTEWLEDVMNMRRVLQRAAPADVTVSDETPREEGFPGEDP